MAEDKSLVERTHHRQRHNADAVYRNYYEPILGEIEHGIEVKRLAGNNQQTSKQQLKNQKEVWPIQPAPWPIQQQAANV